MQCCNVLEFDIWKNQYEIKNKCNYTLARTWKSAREQITYYYNCNRTKTGEIMKNVYTFVILKNVNIEQVNNAKKREVVCRRVKEVVN